VRRLILFDIDGTLVRGGPAKAAFVQAMAETYGTEGDPDRVSFAGKTDPQIAREILSGAGFGRAAIDEAMPALWERYLARLELALATHPVTVLPGVRELLDGLAALDGVALGLVTGNIVGGAKLKLGSAGLWDHFSVGSYGSDHEERDELPTIALERARERWGGSIAARDALIVGDTPRDVACGRACEIRTLAVATGTFSAEALGEAGADYVLDDLSATERVVEILVGGRS
jgi:phosphoglycolate phosphatase-like HAD superfamily hydrolase